LKIISKLAAFLNDRFFFCVIAAVVLGLLLPQAAALQQLVSPVLFLMILGMGLTLTLPELAGVFRRPGRVLAILAVQYTVLPAAAWLLGRLAVDPELRAGMVVLGAAPSEITSALMVFLAGGDAALATAAMALSVLAAPLVMPFALSLLIGQTVHLETGPMFQSLLLIVALPVLAGASVRTRFTRLSDYANECSALAALMVIFLIFIVAAANAGEILNPNVLGLAALLLALNLIGYAAGWGTALLVDRKGDRRPYVFTVGMKEFGVATAVALSFLPSRSALPAAVYGVIMLVTAPYLVKRLRR
jgi:BASS family bile acid:Na+ symporter